MVVWSHKFLSVNNKERRGENFDEQERETESECVRERQVKRKKVQRY